MDVATIRMDPEVALAKLEAYREALRRRADEEYEAAVRGYEALAEGAALIDIAVAFRDVELDHKARPRLAIGRADREQVEFTWVGDRMHFDTRAGFTGQRNETLETMVDRQGGFPGDEYTGARWELRGYALVPMIPADVRPPGNRRKWHVLWEVEEWADRPVVALPDRDPLLLQHLTGTLYVVLAEWDLTDLERAVMTGRAGG